MGLTVSVGLPVDLEDEELAEELQGEFDELNEALRRNGLAEHREPAAVGWEPLSLDMIGYSGLHYLRRIAAHLDANGELPPPGGDDSAEDPVIQAYYERLDAGTGGGLLGRLRRRGPAPAAPAGRFDHLINHSDSEGYYVPQRFDRVLRDERVAGELVGSSHALRAELETLRDALAIPELDPEGDELALAVESQGEGESVWQRYGIESFTCARLLAAAETSVERGAAIVFA